MGYILPGAGYRVQQQWQTQQVMDQVWDTSREPSPELKEMVPETGMKTRLQHRSKGSIQDTGTKAGLETSYKAHIGGLPRRQAAYCIGLMSVQEAGTETRLTGHGKAAEKEGCICLVLAAAFEVKWDMLTWRNVVPSQCIIMDATQR